MKPDYHFRILLLGDSGVGKSCLLFQFCDEIYADSYIATIGVDFKVKTIVYDNQTIRLSIWDTAGQDRFRTIAMSYYRGADGIMICYDVTDYNSFENVTNWIKEIAKYNQNQACQLLVATKCDLAVRKVVDSVSGQELANKLNIPFVETSSKMSTNVNMAFEQLVSQIVSKTKQMPEVQDSKLASLSYREKINLLSGKDGSDKCQCK